MKVVFHCPNCSTVWDARPFSMRCPKCSAGKKDYYCVAMTLSPLPEKKVEPIVPPPPVDRSARTLTDGTPVTDDHRTLKDNGQQKDYVVLSEAERKKGFVRPVRRDYVHKVCGARTTMSREIAETYARDPGFYSGTFCVNCGKHFPLVQFVWAGTDEQVGS